MNLIFLKISWYGKTNLANMIKVKFKYTFILSCSKLNKLGENFLEKRKVIKPS